eukprot:6474167-Amphidinium_carterae.3
MTSEGFPLAIIELPWEQQSKTGEGSLGVSTQFVLFGAFTLAETAEFGAEFARVLLLLEPGGQSCLGSHVERQPMQRPLREEVNSDSVVLLIEEYSIMPPGLVPAS